VVHEIGERLQSVERRFAIAIAAGAQGPALAGILENSGKVDRVFRLEPLAEAFAGSPDVGAAADEEALPLGPESIDLFASVLTLQWANDLPGALIQIRQALRPDGLFLGAMAGGRTLTELREALFAAETELRGGAGPRVLPAAEVRDVGSLLQRAGFALPVVDRDLLTVRYDSALHLMQDLRAMGAGNTLTERDPRPLSRAVIGRAIEIYAERFSDPDGRVRASFEIISLSGWAPHESQQKPARRGSGQVSLADVLGSKKLNL
jgi:SAM-dependent methyltransferase